MDRPDLLVRIAELEAQVARLEHDRGELGEGAILRALMDDIARRRVIETDLRRAHEWLHLAQEAGRVAAYTFDMKAQKLDWSPSTKTLYRFPTDQDATLEGWLAAVHPDDRDAVQAVAQGAITQGRDVDHRFRIVRGDGQILWIQDRARIHLGDDGSPERLVGINVDVTELVDLERRSAENEQRLRLALKAERIACWDWDLVTGAVIWDENLPRFAGLDDEDFGGDFRAFWDLVHEDDRPTVRAALDAAFAGERDYDVSFRMLRPDGSIRRTQTRAIILRDEAGKPLRMVGVDSDITDRYAADEQLRLFNSELHHRLKNNLATVQAMVRTTLRNSPDMATFEKTFTQRLEALGVTYDLLRTGGDSAELADLVRAEVAPTLAPSAL
jgi:PAS domain S-box-containing protein